MPEATSWALCPACWTELSVRTDSEHETYDCHNPDCSMAGQGLKLHIFNDAEKATRFADNATFAHILRGPDSDIVGGGLWIVAIYPKLVECFRLRENEPLTRLLPARLLDSWIKGVQKDHNKDLFRVYALSYDRESGDIREDANGPVFSRYGNDYGEGFCDLCALILKNVREKKEDAKKHGGDFEDPCEECNLTLVRKVISYVQDKRGLIRFLVSDPSADIPEPTMRALSSVCWAGLVSVAVPILICDVIVGIAVTGQKHVRKMQLDAEGEGKRDRILVSLGIDPATYRAFMPQDSFDDLGSLKEAHYNPLRINAYSIQNLAFRRYSQHIQARTQILTDSIAESIRRRLTGDFPTQQAIWDKLAPDGLRNIADFFSFRKAYVFGGYGVGDTRLLISRPAIKGQSGGELLSPSGGIITEAEEAEPRIEAFIRKDIDCEGMIRIVSPEDKGFWYAFADRRFPGGKSRDTVNEVCADSLKRAVTALHWIVRPVTIIQRMRDNLLSMAHNLKYPSGELANVFMYLNTALYAAHNTETTDVFKHYPYLKEAVELVYEGVVSATKKLDFSVERIQHGEDIDSILRRRKYIPVTREDVGPLLQRKSLWKTAVDSVNVFAGARKLSSLNIETELRSQFAGDECIFIHPSSLQIILDNLSDNAVKYSFEDQLIRVRLRRVMLGSTEYAEYSISNYGNGIDESERPVIGQRSYRGLHSTTRRKQVQGTGLGVYTIGRIMKQIGGLWRWESHRGDEGPKLPGEGYRTVFYIYFPICRHLERKK